MLGPPCCQVLWMLTVGFCPWSHDCWPVRDSLGRACVASCVVYLCHRSRFLRVGLVVISMKKRCTMMRLQRAHCNNLGKHYCTLYIQQHNLGRFLLSCDRVRILHAVSLSLPLLHPSLPSVLHMRENPPPWRCGAVS